MSFDIIAMLTLRAQGWSSPRLGREFKVDHSTILYHCRRNGIVPGSPVIQTTTGFRLACAVRANITPMSEQSSKYWNKYDWAYTCCGSRVKYRHLSACSLFGSVATRERQLAGAGKPMKYAHLLEDERVNPGKTYHEYLKEAQKRPAEQAYRKQFGDLYHVPIELRPH